MKLLVMIVEIEVHVDINLLFTTSRNDKNNCNIYI
jgi:hypothetical protein